MTESEENRLGRIIDGIETGVDLPIQPYYPEPDSILDPRIVKAGEPTVDTANKNHFRVNPPDVKLVAPSLPTFTPGTGNVNLPEVIPAIKTQVTAHYSSHIPALSPGFKDNATYNIQYLDVDHGLSSSYIMSIIEDQRGNIWFSSWSAGVTVYDGRSFLHMEETDGLVSNYVWVIFEDSKGNIWFGSDGAGIGMFDGNYFINYGISENENSHIIYDIDEDAEGNIWIASGGGLTKFDGQEFTTYNSSSGLSSDVIRGVDADKKGNIWLATESSGIVRFDGESFIHYTEEQGLVSNWTNTIYVDQDENIWIGTDGDGACLYDGYSFFTYSEAQGLSGSVVKTIFEDRSGNLWIGTSGGGMSKYLYSSFVHYTESEGLSNNLVESAMEDSDGNLWIGTYGAGVNKYNDKSFINFTTNQGLAGDIIRCMREDRENNLWLGHNSGFSIYDGKVFRHYSPDQGLENPQIRSMYQASNGDFWFGTTGTGATRFDGEYFTHYSTENGMSGNIILAIYEDTRKRMWFGTFDGGVTMYDGKQFMHITESNGLATNTILSISEDAKGNIWFGTNGGGAARWNDTTLYHFTSNEGLKGNFIKTIYEDNEGRLWMGTDGEGLNLVLEDTVINYNVDHGLSNNIVYTIIEDYEQNIWASTEYGLNLITFGDSLDFQITNFGKLDGLKAVDFYVNSVCFDNEGKLWWGSGKSLVMLDLNKYERVTEAPEVRINDISLEQTFLDYRALRDSLEQGYNVHLKNEQHTDASAIEFTDMTPFSNTPNNLELPYYLNHLTFHFSAIDWSAPHKLKYQYKMEGLDPEWSPILNDNWATYNNIPQGTYTFKLRAIGEAELWSDTIEYTFTIHPPWWLTWWAYSIYTLFVISSLVFLIRWRTHKLIDHQKKLEQLVSDRTTEVVLQKELVELKNKEITDSITYAKRIQEAILPAYSFVQENLNNVFVLYKPKDIVAGDFYWLEQKGDKVLLASADCTGHGVPGAMVSVVCNNALNRAVREFNLDNPAEILNKVREIVVDTFSQHKSDVKDGMDIALISYNPKTLELEYAGANNSFYLISDRKLRIIKADKQPIGKYAIEKAFTNHKVELKPGDTFYIFTDGYVDQFGGDKGKKFKYKPFLDMLLSIQNMSLEDQKAFIDDVFEEWRGRYEQIDDICIIGVRVDKD